MVEQHIQIVLLHGIGANTLTLIPLELILNWYGWTNTYRLPYPVDEHDFETNLIFIDKELQHVFEKELPIVCIGQSMGGLYAFKLHTLGWNVEHAISIGSPLHGARLVSQLDSVLPSIIRNYFYDKKRHAYDYLMKGERTQEPDHSYNTISLGWFNSMFDGCVYKNEAVIDEDRNVHLAWADHRTIFANPRLGYNINILLHQIK